MNNGERIDSKEEKQCDEFTKIQKAEGHPCPRVHSRREVEFEYFADMRPRTFSMPTKNSYTKPLLYHKQPRQYRSQTAFNADDRHLVRIFEMSSQGQLVKKSDSLWSSSTNSIVSSEGDVFVGVSPTQNSSFNRRSFEEGNGPSEPYSVLVIGQSEVGKTALCQQFQTSEYLGGFNTSLGK
ncbi:hypothetical protein DPMN_171402 [Dreissena polymorpha]|uniref:Uncharacterized protein n=1 Tax=Dreissena polymorpha TaxID=45954 RepID=A0A9D4ICD7_DREPO|nr:hypothetical protein DPMN_171402 [Dreissena polymorpha]